MKGPARIKRTFYYVRGEREKKTAILRSDILFGADARIPVRLKYFTTRSPWLRAVNSRASRASRAIRRSVYAYDRSSGIRSSMKRRNSSSRVVYVVRIRIERRGSFVSKNQFEKKLRKRKSGRGRGSRQSAVEKKRMRIEKERIRNVKRVVYVLKCSTNGCSRWIAEDPQWIASTLHTYVTVTLIEIINLSVVNTRI